jgi:TolB-like protein
VDRLRDHPGAHEGLRLPSWFPALALVLFIIGLPLVLATASVQERPSATAASDPTLLPIRTPGEDGAEDVDKRDGLRRLLIWRNALQVGIAAFALWGVVAAAWVLWRPGREERASEPDQLSATAVAVMPFTFRGDDRFAYLGDGMVDLLSKALDGAGELRAVDPYALLSYLDQRDARRLDPQRGRSLAAHFGAGLFVLGNIIEAGGQLRVDAALYDAGGTQRLSVESTAADESGVFELVDDRRSGFAPDADRGGNDDVDRGAEGVPGG